MEWRLHFQSIRPTLRLWTDASGGDGIGAYILGEGEPLSANSHYQAFSERFTTRLGPRHINVKKPTAVVHALQKWLLIVNGSHLIVHCDNFAVASGVVVA